MTKPALTVTLPKPITSSIEAKGRFGKQDFVYLSDEDVYRCPAGEKLAYHYTNEENGLVLRRYWTNACQSCAIKQRCTTGKERQITRWEHEHVLEAVQKRLDRNPQAMRQRRETAARDGIAVYTAKSATNSTCLSVKGRTQSRAESKQSDTSPSRRMVRTSAAPQQTTIMGLHDRTAHGQTHPPPTLEP